MPLPVTHVSGGYAASSDTLPQEQTDRAQPTFGLLEWCYVAVLFQTVLLNPVVGEVGTLQLYLNTLTWPALAVAATIRWASGRDPRLSCPVAALVAAVLGVVWLIVFQTSLLTGSHAHTTASLLRLLYVPNGSPGGDLRLPGQRAKAPSGWRTGCLSRSSGLTTPSPPSW